MPVLKSDKKIHTNVRLHLGRRSTNYRGDYWCLSIQDDASGAYIGEVEMDERTFSNLLANSTALAPMKLWKSDRHGKMMENVTVRVPIENSLTPNVVEEINTKAQAEADARTEEMGGPPWIPDTVDGWNGHKFSNGKYSVILRRYVEQAQEDSDEPGA